ncbi:hypothetical protein FNL39_11721 [Nocardia caishijiensis]|uniref:Uncharacterized protein n=1 Tax=Nocardia caishijiensis TaxID=184756 RepID=A0ABQ6YED9_9NOCA|nr:hypothetical protein FNL39_11721 [Nocardia caishijiensis]
MIDYGVADRTQRTITAVPSERTAAGPNTEG